MAKSSGLGDRFYLGGTSLSGDVRDLKIASPQAVLDVTDITQSANSRLGGLRDGSMAATVYWDPVTAHPVLSALPTADVICTYLRGVSLGGPAACIVAKQLNYDGTRAADGSYTFTFDAQANAFGLEWGTALTSGVRTDAAATNGSSVDTGGSLSFGAQAYLQVISFTGTDVTVKIQDSADNSTFADVSGLGFTQVTGGAPLAQRISVSNAATIRQYVRAVTVTTGGFTSASFAVVLVKNPVAGVVF